MKKVFSIMCFLLLSYTVMAQKADEVTLVASGSASTEQEATLVALRSAIEQTFGTFVSSNTTMVNDELIKDEIVSISKGNVKKYEKLSSNVLPNGQVSVLVKATICISKLISYAKSKGSSAEFAGQTFAMNMNLLKLREDNSLIVYKHMCEEIKLLSKQAFDLEIELGKPTLYGASKEEYRIIAKIIVLFNDATSQIYKLLNETLKSIQLSPQELSDWKETNKSYYVCRRPVETLNEPYSPFVYRPSEVMYRLPFGEESQEKIRQYDDEVIQSLFHAIFDYKLMNISNSNHFFYWKGFDCRWKWYSSNSEQTIDDDLDLYHFKNAGELYLMNGKMLPYYEKGVKGIVMSSRFDSRTNKITDIYMFMNNRIESMSNWENWKKKRKVLFSYPVPIIISAEEMSTFGGLSIERTYK